MNETPMFRIRQVLLKFGIVAAGFILALVDTFRTLTTTADSATQQDDALGNAIRGGDLNFRTKKFDDGTDPAGWYGRD